MLEARMLGLQMSGPQGQFSLDDVEGIGSHKRHECIPTFKRFARIFA